MKTADNPRRSFIRNALLAGAGTAMAPLFASATPVPGRGFAKAGDGTTFLFQGDSITDGNRTRNNDWNHVMGHGYQYIIASRLWYDFPKKGFHFFNRGISGNTVPDLASRWQQDTLDLKPDVLSILVGINDVSAFIKGKDDYSAAQYESGIRSLLQQTRTQLPGVQLVLCEPFILPVGKLKNTWDAYATEIRKRQEAVQRLSQEFDAVFIPFQRAFNKAMAKAPAEYWIWDGVHPMPAGHELMAKSWLHHVGRQLRFIR